MDELREIVRDYDAEARELLSGLERCLLHLEHSPDDAEALGELFRCVHTLKGNSSYMDFSAVVRGCHEIEGHIEPARQGTGRLDREAVVHLLELADELADNTRKAVDAFCKDLDRRTGARTAGDEGETGRDPGVADMVVTQVGGTLVAVPVGEVIEVAPVPPVAQLLYGPRWCRGLTNLRGQVVPVVDLCPLLEIPRREPGRILVAEVAGHRVAVELDAVRGVRRLPPPTPSGLIHAEGEIITPISVQELLLQALEDEESTAAV